MSRATKTIALHLLLALLFTTLTGTVGCGGAAKKDDDEPDPPPQSFDLSGRVLDNDGAPIEGGDVTARMGDGSNALLATATSAADGRYSVRLPEMTPFYLHVEKPGYADTNTHIREITTNLVDVDLFLLLQVQADSLLGILGGPPSYTVAHLLFQVRALDPAGAEMAGVTLSLTPIGLLRFYRLADDTNYSSTGPTVACTAGGGCVLPQMAGYATAANQGIYVFRMADGSGTFANVGAPLIPGEVTFVAND